MVKAKGFAGRAAISSVAAAVAVAGSTMLVNPSAAASYQGEGCYGFIVTLRTTLTEVQVVGTEGAEAGTVWCQSSGSDQWVYIYETDDALPGPEEFRLSGEISRAAEAGTQSDVDCQTIQVVTQADEVLATVPFNEDASSLPSVSFMDELLGSEVVAYARSNASLRVKFDCLLGSDKTPVITYVEFRFKVLPNPAGEFPGITVNNAAYATSSRDVVLTLSWPYDPPVDRVAISNDGGFQPGTYTVKSLTSNKVAWRLQADDGQLLPKTVYVRFGTINGGYGSTYTDDIILDTTRPTTSGTFSTSTVALTSRGVQAQSSGSLLLTLRSKDDRTGVRRMQLSPRQIDSRVPVTAYDSTTYWSKSVPVIYARVRDGAGNWSSWRSVINPNATRLTASLTDSSIRAGATAVMRGRLTKWLAGTSLGGRTIRIQKYVNGSWATVATRTTDSSGYYRYSWAARTDVKVRAVYAGYSALLPSSSAAKTQNVY